jgi:hypothetical protein
MTNRAAADFVTKYLEVLRELANRTREINLAVKGK